VRPPLLADCVTACLRDESKNDHASLKYRTIPVTLITDYRTCRHWSHSPRATTGNIAMLDIMASGFKNLPQMDVVGFALETLHLNIYHTK
jgi:hypothetical protein